MLLRMALFFLNYPVRISQKSCRATLYTTGSAYTSYEENVKGKLCPGYLADFIVLSQDIFSVPENEIVNTKVEQTYLGGKLVYSR